MRFVALAALLMATVGHAHDLALDVIGTATTTSQNNPRAGSVGASLSGAYDLTDRWSAWGGFTYTRDLA
ncbi:MAG: hypothetical protein JNG84_05180, partial [Archangium sp.]|nr:hypothetical protein [Archangium sp.]